jgi:hypothetical protein
MVTAARQQTGGHVDAIEVDAEIPPAIALRIELKENISSRALQIASAKAFVGSKSHQILAHE